MLWKRSAHGWITVCLHVMTLKERRHESYFERLLNEWEKGIISNVNPIEKLAILVDINKID